MENKSKIKYHSIEKYFTIKRAAKFWIEFPRFRNPTIASPSGSISASNHHSIRSVNIMQPVDCPTIYPRQASGLPYDRVSDNIC
jgi:hypothetical protein